MSTLGKYCKAYPLHQLRQFSGWTEERQNARRIRKEIDGETTEILRELTDGDYLYVQENFTVTDGIFLDENVIFSAVTPEWIEFCRNVLGWEVPPEEPATTTERNQVSGEA
jgi:hypothetical protein